MTSVGPAHAMIVETFFLVADKRSLRTLFYQDLCRGQGSGPGRGDMPGRQPASGQLRLSRLGQDRFNLQRSGTQAWRGRAEALGRSLAILGLGDLVDPAEGVRAVPVLDPDQLRAQPHRHGPGLARADRPAACGTAAVIT